MPLKSSAFNAVITVVRVAVPLAEALEMGESPTSAAARRRFGPAPRCPHRARERSDHARVRDRVGDARSRRSRSPQGSVFWLAGVAMFAGVAAAAADGELLDLCGTLLEPCADHVIVFGTGTAVLGPVHYWLGVVDAVVGRVNHALERFGQATRITRRIEAPYWRAQSRSARPACCAAGHGAGDEPEIQRLERDALALARPRGYDRVIAQAGATS